ncbi:allantoate permease [Apiospora rasikravindrae]|uniref:Allantoate permease n=1 Tax=Apiospora rasikravindrae TaxID=990691 RepID=A0ABR1TW23_9PEZI
MFVPPIQTGLPAAVAVESTAKGLDVHSSQHSDSEAAEFEYYGPNPFSDPEAAAHWKQTYENSQYECRHVFDPTATWTAQEERAVIRKVDWRVCLWACVMFFGLQVDRGNLVQAVSDNMLDDLNLTTDDYNYGNTVFLLSFLLAELPSQLVSKKIGPDRWIPMQICLWSIVACSQCALSGRGSFLATRALLGLLEGGFIPDVVLWLSYFYTSRELPIRLSYFWTTLSVTGILTSLLAFALLRMRGIIGWSGWRWLFLIEGLITLLVGIASFFMMPASAVQTKTWFRPRGWFTDREVTIVVNRLLRDDPSKGDMHNRQAITPRRLWNSLCDYDLWPLYILGLVVYIPQSPPSKYITLILKSAGFNTFDTNLLTIPSSFAHIVTLLLLTRLADYVNERSLVSSIQAWWTLPCVIALRWWPGLIKDVWGTYAIVTTLLSYPYCHAILVAWTSRNSNNVGTRSVSAAVYNMAVQLGNIMGNFIYRDDDKPLYRRGNGTLVANNVLAIFLFFATKAYYMWRNKQRDAVWDAMTEEERRAYTKDTRLQGSRRLDFRFAH